MTAKERDEVLKKYLTLKAEAADIEGQLSMMRSKILENVKPGQYGDVVVLIEDQERESFSLKEARSKLSESVLNKIGQFIKRSEYQTLKVVKS